MKSTQIKFILIISETDLPSRGRSIFVLFRTLASAGEAPSLWCCSACASSIWTTEASTTAGFRWTNPLSMDNLYLLEF